MASRRDIAARIHIFQIDHLDWHYAQGNPASIPVPLEAVLEGLTNFAGERRLGDTSTFAPTDGIPQSYLLDISSEPDNHLITLWIATDDSPFAHYASKRSASGNITITDKPAPADAIPGFPCHFWIMPNAEFGSHANIPLIATVQTRPTHLTGLPSLRAYLEGYLRTSPPTSIRIPSNLYNARLITRRLFNQNATNSDIVSGWADIVQIACQETIHGDVPPAETWISKIQRFLRIEEPNSKNKTKWKFESSSRFTPKSADEVAEIIRESLTAATSTDDEQRAARRLGFKFKNGAGRKPQIHWTSKSQAISRQHLNVTTLSNSSVLDPKSLLQAVIRTRQGLLDAID
jgi:hypothetical protein